MRACARKLPIGRWPSQDDPGRSPGRGWHRRFWVSLLAASLAVILGLTLVSSSEPDTGTASWCLLCGHFGLSDAVANVLLFVPLAIALRYLGVSGRRTMAIGLLLAVVIEYVQLRIPGRDSTPGDVVWNTLGTAPGLALVWLPHARRRSALRVLAETAAALGVIAGTGLLQRPSFPPTIHYGQWTAPWVSTRCSVAACSAPTSVACRSQAGATPIRGR